MARRAIEAVLCGRVPPALPDVPGAQLKRGAFVTLEETESHDLRGCIGHVSDDRPLGEVIRQVAVSAARSDPRFPPVEASELAGLRIEISVLSTPALVSTADLCPDPDEKGLVMGRDGVLVRQGRTQALLLPQVATEQGLSREAFLSAACHKAGLAPQSWREPATQVFTFTADVFVE